MTGSIIIQHGLPTPPAISATWAIPVVHLLVSSLLLSSVAPLESAAPNTSSTGFLPIISNNISKIPATIHTGNSTAHFSTSKSQWEAKLIPAILTLMSFAWSIAVLLNPQIPPFTVVSALVCGMLFSMHLPSYFWHLGAGDAIVGFLLFLMNGSLLSTYFDISRFVDWNRDNVYLALYSGAIIATVPLYYLFAGVETVEDEQKRRFIALCSFLRLPITILGILFRSAGIRPREDCPYHSDTLEGLAQYHIHNGGKTCYLMSDVLNCAKQHGVFLDCILTGYAAPGGPKVPTPSLHCNHDCVDGPHYDACSKVKFLVGSELLLPPRPLILRKLDFSPV